MNRLTGVLLALGGFVLWGLSPIYWKQLPHLHPLEVLSHRVIWSAPFLILVMAVAGSLPRLVHALREYRKLPILVLSAAMVSINWGVYIWAVSANKVVEASMGYFLTPLLNVLIGLLVFRERLRRMQWLAVSIAALGVLWLFQVRGVPPWVALTLGISFAVYGALRKSAAQDTLAGLFVETLIVAPFALVLLGALAARGQPGFLDFGAPTLLLALGAGLMTATPLILFVAGARRLHYSTVGVVFYVTPTLQFLIGAFVYDEPLPAAELAGFACIWLALAIFALHGYVVARRTVP